nr:MAG TPA: hypothetical protein [Caudoviricetes sp.]
MDRSCDATRFDKIESATQNCQWIRGFKPKTYGLNPFHIHLGFS